MRHTWKDPYKWRRWFAWRPVLVGERTVVWLETVSRRKVACIGAASKWEYKVHD